MKHFTDRDGNIFCAFAFGNNLLCAQKVYGPGRYDFCKKNIRVEEDAESVYKLMKTKIKAAGGAPGLLRFLEECENETDFCGAFRSKIYNWIFDSMK